ncbi:MAG TPA: TatD family hydrolase [Chthoniobacteraceae bacterium]|jgi:TatD DNase family protein|nr:TatD family hydrolase [Chthoniobacteraceae bacterium]
MLCDAHNHLHDTRLTPFRAAIRTEMEAAHVERAVVNGTSEADWEAVAELARTVSGLTSAFGLHPWKAAQRSPSWLDTLRRHLDADPTATVGEIGLDRWIEGHDLDHQRDVFIQQLALAAERNVAATIHCIRAWGALWEVLREQQVPARGFLIHAYGGPAEMVTGFVERGAYFSFSPYFLHPRKTAQRDIFAQIPADRLLVETDAPDLRPPDERNAHPLQSESGEPLNHPANLTVAYAGLAEIRTLAPDALEQLIEENFTRLFPARSGARLHPQPRIQTHP